MSILELVIISAIFDLATEACQLRDSKFKRNTSLTNWVHPDHLLFQSSARSRLGCARQCSETSTCVSFTYPGSRYTPGTCRGHSTRHFSVGDAERSVGVSTFLMKENIATNVAIHKPATQSSNHHPATLATDGSFITDQISPYPCTHTDTDAVAVGVRSWWQVDLEACYAISSVTITTRGDCCAERLHDFDVDVYEKDPDMYPGATAQRCHHYVGHIPAGATEELVCGNQPTVGRVVRVTNAPEEILTLCEVQVMAAP